MKVAALVVLFALAASAAAAEPLSPRAEPHLIAGLTVNETTEALAQNLMATWPIDRETAEKVATMAMYYAPADEPAAKPQTAPKRQPFAAACPSLPYSAPPTEIGQLKPADIVAVGAIGDSLTTASNAESTTWFNLKEYPGISWSMGGDAGDTSMPNLMETYTGIPLLGQSTGSGDSAVRNFNFAVGGAVVSDLPGQATQLIAAMKADPKLDWENDWKLVSVFIGGNNLCLVCDPSKAAANSAANYYTYLEDAFDVLAQMPRTLVSINSHLDYTQLAQYKGPFCSMALVFVCDCLTTNNAAKQATARSAIYAYNAVLQQIAADYNDPSNTQFAVVVQTPLVNATIPNDSYVSTADCFHPSLSGQQYFGVTWWNSLISPMDAKPVAQPVSTQPVCPGPNTYLYNFQTPTSSY